MKSALRYFRYAIALAGVLLAGYCILQYKLVTYGISQLYGQLSIILESKSVEECLSDPAFPDSLRVKLEEVQRIRQFAMDSLGLTKSRNYTTFYDQHGQPSLWVLTASAPFALEALEWDFPFLGKVPYKGFFRKEKGMEEEKQLRQLGFDTEYSPVGGWSTLGFLSDPILSNMLKRSSGALAELIIHELTHATVYLSGSTDYNENFATFTGEQGARLYLRSAYGADSEEMKNYDRRQKDEALFGAYMLRASERLDSLYRAIKHLKEAEKKQKKTRMIQNLVLGIKQIGLYHPERYDYLLLPGQTPNNCFFMGYRRYRKQQDEFHKALEAAGGDLKTWLAGVKEQAGE